MVLANTLRRLARLTACAVATVALLVLAGYVAGMPSFITVLPGRQGMAIVTALGLLCLAVAIVVESFDLNRHARTLSGAAAGIGLVMLLMQAAFGTDPVNPWFSETVFGYPRELAGRTSIATATCLTALGLAGALRERPHWTDVGAGFALIVAGTALLGYCYGVDDLYAVRIFNSMALNTAIGLFAVALTMMLVRPERGWAAVVTSSQAGGIAARRQLAFIAMPPIAGWVLLQAIGSRDIGAAAAMAFLVIVTVVPLTLLILREGRIVNVLEGERAARLSMQLTQRQMLESRLADQATQLAAESAERLSAEAALQRARRMEAVGQLTGGIAHDFNNLLMGIGGNLQLLVRRLEVDHPGRRHAELAKGAVDRGAKLAAQLLAFSRTQRLEVRSVELDSTLKAACELLGNALGPAVTVTIDLDAACGWVTTDANQLELAVLNLALNARDAMPGGGSLKLESRSGVTRLGDDVDAVDCCVVRVIDSGEGMTPGVLAQAIEPFFTTKEQGKGTGLGLAQVYGFVKQCRGDLRIQSEPGVGTTVEIWLRSAPPAVDAPSLGLADESTDTAPGLVMSSPGERKLLLVIDDDDAVRGVLVDTLRSVGFDVVEASNGVDGLALLDRLRPSAAIIDFIMPGLNGAEVARRAQQQVPGLPIIFVSGYYDTLALDGISHAAVLRKPFDIDGLQRAVNSMLS